MHSTVPVPREKWFEYGAERSGRFQGLTDKDGKKKTECGIHVSDDKPRPFDRDLWGADTAVVELSIAQLETGTLRGRDALLVVYAPWCPFCQKMEGEFTRLAAATAGSGLLVAKLRGDTVREFAGSRLATKSFPTLLALSAAPGPAAWPGVVKYESEERSAEAMLAFANGVQKAQRVLRA